MSDKPSPLRGRYLVRNPLWNGLLRAADFVNGLVTRSGTQSLNGPPRRLLLAIGGHTGDAIIATSVLGPIRAAWPTVRIGVVSGSWNREILANHPDIQWLHTVDHWKLDRSKGSWFTRARRAAASHRASLKEIKVVGYDSAVDLYAYYPNASPLLRAAAIPVRVGYASGGGAANYTHALEWTPGGRVVDDHSRLLAALGISPEVRDTSRYCLPPIPEEAASRANQLLDAAGSAPNYVVLHMGAGRSRKSWPAPNWVAVARELLNGGVSVVLTGAGPDDAERTRRLTAELPHLIDLCNTMTWAEFRQVAAGARAVISVDTAAAHLAAAEGTPTTVLMTGMHEPERWRPLGDHVTVLTRPVSCAPCYLRNGCAAMTCVTGVSVSEVLGAVRPHLSLQGSLQ